MLSDIPIIARIVPSPAAAQELEAERLAAVLQTEHPEFASDEQFRKFMPDSLPDGCCLHLDDLSEIQLLEFVDDYLYMQDRARLRAGDKDLVASVTPESEGYEDYCRQYLQLGSVDWLRPTPTPNPLQIAHACWEDRSVRNELLHHLRTDTLHYLHPHMGTLGSWELAALLHEHSRRPIKVIAPPPALTGFANNKVFFADVVRRLLGPGAVPRTSSAWNMATLCQRITEFPDTVQNVGVKRPDSAGGIGIVVLSMERFRGKSLPQVHDLLVIDLEPLHWDDGCELLIGAWEAGVLCSPSVQIWIPPERDGLPVVEGIFTQHLKQGTAEFDGTAVANFPANITSELATQAWLIARVFQRLGYIGRCSFDTILVGESLNEARIEFIECNGRWGGTSLPMTLMNRVFGDWRKHPFAVSAVQADGLDRLSFGELVTFLGNHVYDARTGNGELIFFAPDRLRCQSGITVLATAESSSASFDLLNTMVPQLLQSAASRNVVG